MKRNRQMWLGATLLCAADFALGARVIVARKIPRPPIRLRPPKKPDQGKAKTEYRFGGAIGARPAEVGSTCARKRIWKSGNTT